jgi:RNA-directed DNA polymerase
MCNVYLHRLDRAWDERDGVLVRFADDRAPRARLEVAM